MWNFGFVVLILSWTVNGQDQFLREVTNPSGPSQVILRGGALNSIGNGEEGGQQVEERYVLTDQPQQQNEQALPFQSPQESPIPEDGGENNPFTNGENGFGLRLSQQGPVPPQVQRQVQQVQAAQPRQPQVLQPQYPIYQQQQQPVEIDQPAPIIHQTEVNLPQLPPGQQYVDVYGRPIVLEQPQVLQQVASQPAPSPSPSPSPTPTSAPTAPPPPTQILVDQYGRQLTQFQHQPQYLTQQFLQPGAVPVAHHHHVLQPAVPHVEHVLQPASVAIPAVATQTHLVAHSPGLTLQTYAVPAVRKVGNLVIPYAQKVQYAAKIPKVDIVFPPTVPAPAVVKSRHRTVYSPTKVLTPAVQEVHHHVQPVQEVHHHVQPVQEVHHHVQPVQEVHHHVQPVQEVHHHVQPVQEVHHVQPVQEVHHHVQPVQEVHHVAPPVQQVHALPAAPVPVVNLSHPQLLHHPPGLVPVHAPQVLHHPPGLVPVPAPQVLHHPPGLVPVPGPQVLHHPPGLVPVHAPGQVLLQHPPPVALPPHPQQLVQVGHPLAAPVPVGPHVVEHHLHPQPHAVVPVAPAVHVEKHIFPGPTPVVVKKVKPLITKTIVPEVTLIHQPVLPKVLFQRHIFNVKHGSEPIIYQDLCTVYPYQKNLRACVLKKATLPELHHPDIRTINVEQHQTDQSVIAAGSPIVAPASPTSSPSVTVTKALPQNIQDTIQRESARLREAATKNSETTAAEAPSTSAQPDTAESRTNSSRSGKSRRKKNKGSTSRQTTTTEKPFKLA